MDFSLVYTSDCTEPLWPPVKFQWSNSLQRLLSLNLSLKLSISIFYYPTSCYSVISTRGRYYTRNHDTDSRNSDNQILVIFHPKQRSLCSWLHSRLPSSPPIMALVAQPLPLWPRRDQRPQLSLYAWPVSLVSSPPWSFWGPLRATLTGFELL